LGSHVSQRATEMILQVRTEGNPLLLRDGNQLLCDAPLKPVTQRGLDAWHGASEGDGRVEIVLADRYRAPLTRCGLGAALGPAAADLAGAVTPWTPDGECIRVMPCRRQKRARHLVMKAEPLSALRTRGAPCSAMRRRRQAMTAAARSPATDSTHRVLRLCISTTTSARRPRPHIGRSNHVPSIAQTPPAKGQFNSHDRWRRRRPRTRFHRLR
jgi:hypothetical protein